MDNLTASGLQLLEAGSTMLSIKIDGELCYENCDGILEITRSALERKPQRIELDMGDVAFVDSSGLRAMLQCWRYCDEAGVRFELAAASTQVTRIIRMSGFGEVFGLPRVEIDEIKERIGSVLDGSKYCWKVSEHVASSEASVVPSLRDAAVSAARQAGADGIDLVDIQIAVGEAITNAYKHGSPNKGKNRIRMCCLFCSKVFVIEIEDEGPVFDPNVIAEPEPSKMRECGMGIYLMRQAMDVVEIDYNGSGNRIRMIKWL